MPFSPQLPRAVVTRRRVLSGIGATLALPMIGGRARADQQVVFAGYGGSAEKFMRGVVIPSFEQATGIKVVYVVGTALSNYSRVVANKRRPELDIYWSNDLSHVAGKLQSLYAPLDPKLVPNLEKVYAFARDPDGIGVASNYSVTGLQYNPRKLEEAGVPVPSSWLDLWDPKLKGRVAIYSIGVLYSQDFLAMMMRITGGNYDNVSAAIKKVKAMREMGNIAAFPSSPAEMDNVLVQEQAWVSCNSQTRALTLMQGGSPLRFAQPKEGAPIFKVITDVIKGGPNPEGAQKFINHMLSDEMQSATAQAIGYAPVNMKATIPTEFRGLMPENEKGLAGYVELDRVAMNRVLDNWIELWNRDIETSR